jgi:outer membrane protein insertion porin family
MGSGLPAGGVGTRVLLALSLAGGIAVAQPAQERDSDVPTVRVPERGDSARKKIVRVEVLSTDASWPAPAVTVPLVIGERFDPAQARRAARELTRDGTAAETTVEALPEEDGVLVRILVTPQRVVGELRVNSEVDVADALRSSGIERGRAVTPVMLRDGEGAVLARVRARGYPNARVAVSVRSTDDPRVVLVLCDVIAGPPLLLAGVRMDVLGLALPPDLREDVMSYGLKKGDVADEEDLEGRDRTLTQRLRSRGYHRATVVHRLYERNRRTFLHVVVRSGPLVRVRYEGNRALDEDQLDDIIDLEKEADRSPTRVAQKIREEYERIGFLDAEVTGAMRGEATDPIHHMVVKIREGDRVKVAARMYPCLTGERKAKDVGSEIDSFLEEELPGATLLSPVDPAAVDKTFGAPPVTGARPAPLELSPRSVYAAQVYDRAIKHVQDLYRSEGYLTALVGPVQVVRRRCDPMSLPGQCRPIPVASLEARCAVDGQGVPVEEPAIPAEMQCRPNPLKGITCEPNLYLRIPVKPGPLAILYDVAFDGALAISETKLLEVSGLKPGGPASNVAVEEARKAILDRYKDEGFAFAEVAAAIDLSPDKQRARVRFTLLERQRVTVDRIVIRGNLRTLDSVIRTRLRFRPGDLYRQNEVRRSEELVATLGTFSSVTIGLEDPAIPATRKTVVVTVAERDPQYLEFRPGVSTGEGVRGLLEYGHRNLGGRAIQLTFRVQLNYLPDFLIPDRRVAENFDKLPLGQRLERRNTASIQFPNVFDPTLRFGVDLIDVRSNSRDFGLTKDALIPTFTYSPLRQVTGTIGASVELNNVGIFSGQTVETYLQQPGISNDLSRLLRVPDGETTAVAQRVTAVWDRRDNPLGATRGTLLAASVEHVHAYPAESNPNTINSDFLRFSGRVGGYVRITKRGLALAMLVGGGYNRQLISGSKTYPDRLFFLGGVDTIRGFTRDALVPQDIANRLEQDSTKAESDPTRLTIDKIAIRGGDVFLNPRTELRVPLSGPVETALFVDAGNLWVDPLRIEPLRLRYAGGSGLRVSTPVGPIAFDYGINLNRRFWEDFGAFHFSIGLF